MTTSDTIQSSSFPTLPERLIFGCSDPRKPVPSITRQTQWPCHFCNFSNRSYIQYFNPAIIDWRGSRWLITRRRRIMMHPGKNDITAWSLNAAHQPVFEQPITIPRRFGDEHWEDPRALITRDGRFLLSYSNFRTYNSKIHQAAAWIDSTWRGRAFHPVYGLNRDSIRNNVGNEKNWLWFDPPCGGMHFVYDTSPVHRVVSYWQQADEVYTAPGPTWNYGHIRGGSTPILFAGLYWSFFHSSLDINPEPPRRRYYMGAYAFSADPPFTPVCATTAPLLAGSESDPKEPSAPYCVFPCGALLDHAASTNPTWTVALGVNDCQCAIIRIPHKDLVFSMTPVCNP